MDWDVKALGKVKVIQNQVKNTSTRKHVGTKNSEHRRNVGGIDTSTMNTRDEGTRDAEYRKDMRGMNKVQ